jgi:hypothetical protein
MENPVAMHTSSQYCIYHRLRKTIASLQKKLPHMGHKKKDYLAKIQFCAKNKYVPKEITIVFE